MSNISVENKILVEKGIEFIAKNMNKGSTYVSQTGLEKKFEFTKQLFSYQLCARSKDFYQRCLERTNSIFLNFSYSNLIDKNGFPVRMISNVNENVVYIDKSNLLFTSDEEILGLFIHEILRKIEKFSFDKDYYYTYMLLQYRGEQL
jgi:hypothetical protein